MATRTLDIATLLKAFGRLSDEIGDGQWDTTGGKYDELQRYFLGLYQDDRQFAEQLTALAVECSDNHHELNRFLTSHSFEPWFREISKGGLGVAAVLDMLVEWTQTAKEVPIYRRTDAKTYPGFEVSPAGVQLYSVPSYQLPMACLETKNGNFVWLAMVQPHADDLEMVQEARNLLTSSLTPNNNFAGVQVPMIDIDTRVDLAWLLGMVMGDYYIDQAFQMLKLRMNETGARAKAATGLAVKRSISFGPEPLVFDEPFLLFFTQPNIPVPIATCYVDIDSWQQPTGTLHEL